MGGYPGNLSLTFSLSENQTLESSSSNKHESEDKVCLRFHGPKTIFGPDIDHDLLIDFLEKERIQNEKYQPACNVADGVELKLNSLEISIIDARLRNIQNKIV